MTPTSPPPDLVPLPRGRHKLSPETVRASQRARLMRAMIECVSEQGFSATTVPQVVATARVSRNAFYEFFADKTDCFIAIMDEAGQQLLSELMALASEPDWEQALRQGLRIYLNWWRDRPEMSRAYLLELPMAGARAVEQRERVYEQYRGMFAALGARARAERAGLPPLSPLTPRIMVAGTTALVTEEVRAGRLPKLLDLESELLEILTQLLTGGRQSGI